MNKTSRHSSVIGLMTAALSAGCGAQKHDTLQPDNHGGNMALTDAASQTKPLKPLPMDHPQTSEAKAKAPEAPAADNKDLSTQGPATEDQTHAVQVLAPAAQGQTRAAQVQAHEVQTHERKSELGTSQEQTQMAQELPAQASVDKAQELPAQASVDKAQELPAQASVDKAQELPAQASVDKAQELPAQKAQATQDDAAMMSQQGAPYQQYPAIESPAPSETKDTAGNPSLSPTLQQQASAQVNQWFVAEGRQGVLTHIEESIGLVEKDLAALEAQAAADIKERLDGLRLRWKDLEQIEDDNVFLDKSTEIWSDLNEIAVIVSQYPAAAQRP